MLGLPSCFNILLFKAASHGGFVAVQHLEDRTCAPHEGQHRPALCGSFHRGAASSHTAPGPARGSQQEEGHSKPLMSRLPRWKCTRKKPWRPLCRLSWLRNCSWNKCWSWTNMANHFAFTNGKPNVMFCCLIHVSIWFTHIYIYIYVFLHTYIVYSWYYYIDSCCWIHSCLKTRPSFVCHPSLPCFCISLWKASVNTGTCGSTNLKPIPVHDCQAVDLFCFPSCINST